MPNSDVLLPSFPNKNNAVYDEWKIYFENLLPFFGDDVRLVGHSQGAMFLAKYLHDHVLDTNVRQLILVAPGYDDPTMGDVGSFKVASATGLERSADEIHLFHSQDDFVVPFTELAKFQRDAPSARVHTFTDRGTFSIQSFQSYSTSYDSNSSGIFDLYQSLILSRLIFKTSFCRSANNQC